MSLETLREERGRLSLLLGLRWKTMEGGAGSAVLPMTFAYMVSEGPGDICKGN